MKLIQPFLLFPLVFTLSLWSASPIPYSGKIDIRGVNYFGEAQFAFSLYDGEGTTHWRNGNQPGETIKVTIRNGRYSVLLGGQGMNTLAPELFLNHDKLYLKVEVDMGDGEGLRHLAPDQLITATPRALVAELAKVAEKVGNGAITREMLSSEVLAQLDANATASPSAPITITRDMLPASVLNDLNKTVSITRDMLPQDVRDDLNKTVTITRSMLPTDVLADLNKSSSSSSPITLSMLAPEVTAKLDQNGSGAGGVVAGSLISVPYGQPAPAGYSLYKGSSPKNISWEKLREASSDLNVSLSVSSTIQNEIFMTRGSPPSTQILKFNPVSNQVVKNINMQTPRYFASTANFNDYFYVIGGYDGNNNLSSVEIYDPNINQWSFGPTLPLSDRGGHSIVFNNDLYYFSGIGGKGIYKLDGQSNSWTFESNMTSTKWNFDLVVYENKIWILGGRTFGSGGGYPKVSEVEIYDPLLKTIVTGVDMLFPREGLDSWVANNLLFAAGGGLAEAGFSIEVYDPLNSSWELVGDLPTKGGVIEIVGNYIYTVKGELPDENATDYIYRYNLELFDLYRKDGNASAGTPLVQVEVADGSVTASKMADGAVTANKMANNSITTSQLNEQILKYLKPEITSQPQAQTVYADNNVSYSVTAEGKYLTYQWKKDGADLTGESNATLNITDANATLHDGNYSVMVSNDFGSVETVAKAFFVLDTEMTGLVGWWPFDGNTSDMSGNGRHGTVNGAVLTKDRLGIQNRAYEFNGNDFIEVSHHESLDFNKNDPFSLSVWFKPKSGNVTFSRSIISKWDGTGPYPYVLRFLDTNSNTYFARYDGTQTNNLGVSVSNIGSSFSHAVVVSNGSKIMSYANSNFLSEINISGGNTSNNKNIYFGKRGNTSAPCFFYGTIDDVRIYDRALSAAEVQALYNLGQ